MSNDASDLRTLVALQEVAIENLQHVNDLHRQEIERLRAGIRQCATTLVKWAVAFGGHTPSAIIASKLRVLVGDEMPLVEVVACDIDGNPIDDAAQEQDK